MPRVVLLARRVCFLILLLAFRPVFGWDFYRRNNITLCLVRILQAPTHRSRVMFAEQSGLGEARGRRGDEMRRHSDRTTNSRVEKGHR